MKREKGRKRERKIENPSKATQNCDTKTLQEKMT